MELKNTEALLNKKRAKKVMDTYAVLFSIKLRCNNFSHF